MKEKDLRKEAYKESKKSQRKETVIVFAVIAGAGALFWCALISINFWFGCALQGIRFFLDGRDFGADTGGRQASPVC